MYKEHWKLSYLDSAESCHLVAGFMVLHINERSSPYRAVKTLRLGYKTSQLLLYRDMIVVCSRIHIKHINTFCEQNVHFVSVNRYI
jgi:hypothetical protein